MLSNRPKLSPELSTFDKVINVLAWIALVGFLISVYLIYNKLPEIIPVHYSLNGEPDRWSTKSELLTLIIVVTLIFSALTFFSHKPRLFNYPIRITEENAQNKYNLAARMMRVTRLTITTFFIGLVWFVLNQSSHDDFSYSWFFVIGVIVIVAPVIYYYWKLMRSR